MSLDALKNHDLLKAVRALDEVVDKSDCDPDCRWLLFARHWRRDLAAELSRRHKFQGADNEQ